MTDIILCVTCLYMSIANHQATSVSATSRAHKNTRKGEGEGESEGEGERESERKRERVRAEGWRGRQGIRE